MDTAPFSCPVKIPSSYKKTSPNLGLLAMILMCNASAKRAGNDPTFERPTDLKPIRREWHAKRNGPCPCGSEKKFKKCCRSNVCP